MFLWHSCYTASSSQAFSLPLVYFHLHSTKKNPCLTLCLRNASMVTIACICCWILCCFYYLLLFLLFIVGVCFCTLFFVDVFSSIWSSLGRYSTLCMTYNDTVNHVLIRFLMAFQNNRAWKLIFKIKSPLMLNEDDEKGICFLNMKESDYEVSCSMRKKAGVWKHHPRTAVGRTATRLSQCALSTFSLLHLHGRFLSSFAHQYLFDLHQPCKLKVAALHLGQG